MRSLIAIVLVLFIMTNSVLAQTAEEVTQAPAEPALINQIALYGLTAIGVGLLLLSFLKSKWGKKS